VHSALRPQKEPELTEDGIPLPPRGKGQPAKPPELIAAARLSGATRAIVDAVRGLPDNANLRFITTVAINKIERVAHELLDALANPATASLTEIRLSAYDPYAEVIHGAGMTPLPLPDPNDTDNEDARSFFLSLAEENPQDAYLKDYLGDD